MSEARKESRVEERDAPTGRQVAVVGMAGRFPGARDLTELWRNLREGREAVSRFGDDELLAAGVEPALLADPSYVKAGSVLDGADLFDAPFFGYSAREAELLDPQQRLFLEQVWHALEDAGYAGQERSGGLVGLYAGVAWNTYLLTNLASRPELFGGAGGFQVFITNDKDFMPTRVSYKLDLKGPSVIVQTSCSTSLVAVHLACLSLLSYECDLALAGGVTVKVPQVAGYHHEEGGLASPDGRCRAFDARAAGTVFGSGVGVVALKRLDDALADGDTIRAVVRGSAINNDGSAKVSYTAPSVEGQAEVIAAAQAVAGVSPDTIRYVEAHGTGTSLGDPIEVAALTRVFRESTGRRGFCGLGSIKTNLGHLDAAAGIAGLIKTVLALEHRELPPSLHFEEPNPEIDFPASPFYVQRALEPWERDGAPRRAGVSSFGVGGTNAHAVLEEAPEAPEPAPARPWQLLPVSARSEAALRESVARLAAWLPQAEPSEAALADVAHTLQVGRAVFRHRAFAVCRDGADAAAALAGGTEGLETAVDEDEPRERAVAFLFPDLAPADPDRLPGLSRELYEHEPVYREQLDRAAEAAAPLVGLDVRAALGAGDGSAPALDRPEVARAALFAVEHALARLWISWGIRPGTTLGCGVGEAVAGCVEGTLPLEAAVARAIEGRPAPDGARDGGPAAARLDEDLAALFAEPDRIALVVGPGAALAERAGRHPSRGETPVVPCLDPAGGAESGPRRRLLTALGRLWLAGVRVDWAGFRGDERRRRVPLPLYPFEGRRFWIDPAPRAAAATAEESGELAKRPDPADWFYLPSWRRTLPPPAAGEAGADEDGGWLVLRPPEDGGAGAALGGLLAERLRAAGRRVAEVAPGDSFRALGEDAWAVDPARPEDWRALAAALAGP
ncbi:MAG TPA: type I polyketide synthase, partial [Thermoanaerobaculia bacterium]|nr:type I polyketide synthase [Thermoanaerobaculia bacterium]